MQLCSCTLCHRAPLEEENRVHNRLRIGLEKVSKAVSVVVGGCPAHKILPQGFKNWTSRDKVFNVFSFKMTKAAAVIGCFPNLDKSLLGECQGFTAVDDQGSLTLYNQQIKMPVSPEELVRLLAILAEEENMKVTVKETLKGGAIAGAGAVIGGMCGGPMGLAVGGALGGAYARWKYKGKHDLVADLLRGMEDKQREELSQQFRETLEDYPEDDFMMMTRRLNEDGELREKMRLKLKTFITDTLKRQLIEEYKQRGKAD